MISAAGKSNWQIWGDYLCTNQESQSYQMNLNSAGSEYNCDNGDCVYLSTRCNGMCDCTDCSDENNCKLLDTLVNYNKGLLTAKSGGLASVVFDTVVDSIGSIDDSAGLISLSLAVSIMWYDFRLIYLNLNPNK